jgi:hypothetical protein
MCRTGGDNLTSVGVARIPSTKARNGSRRISTTNYLCLGRFEFTPFVFSLCAAEFPLRRSRALLLSAKGPHQHLAPGGVDLRECHALVDVSPGVPPDPVPPTRPLRSTRDAAV